VSLYLDTSALLKRYIDEEDSDEGRSVSGSFLLDASPYRVPPGSEHARYISSQEHITRHSPKHPCSDKGSVGGEQTDMTH
jgi:hypothetical protein